MEQYLIDEYDVFEDEQYLTKESEIEEYFLSNDSKDFFDCGQGYFQDEHTLICRVGDDFYRVIIYAEIGSAKQDVGDRLYWVDDIKSVKFGKIDKPKPKEKKIHEYKVEMTVNQHRLVKEFFEDNKIRVLYHSFPVNAENLVN